MSMRLQNGVRGGVVIHVVKHRELTSDVNSKTTLKLKPTCHTNKFEQIKFGLKTKLYKMKIGSHLLAQPLTCNLVLR